MTTIIGTEELHKRVSDEVNISPRFAAKILKAYMKEITWAVAKGDEVYIAELGEFFQAEELDGTPVIDFEPSRRWSDKLLKVERARAKEEEDNS